MLYRSWGVGRLLLFFVVPFTTCFLGMALFICLMKKYSKFQPIRAEGPKTHQKKAKTPTMGGVVIVLAIVLNILLFCNLNSPHIAVAVFLLLIFFAIGLVDDIIKVFYSDSNGFKGSWKLLLQIFFVGIAVLYLCYRDTRYLTAGVALPIFNAVIPLGILTPAFYVLIMCGSSNAANFTDGLDGLLAIPVIIISTVFLISAALLSNGCSYHGVQFDGKILQDIIVMMISVIAAFSSFFIYNRHPAKIFMGDTGSLMIGALLCYTAILLKIEIIYALAALLFIVEILSTMLQVAYFRITNGKRLLKMAPFHHHLEKIGWSEKKVVVSMWIFNLICCSVAFMLFYHGLQC